MANQILPSRAGNRDRPRRADVVGSHTVAHHDQDARVLNGADGLRLRRHILEKRRLLNVSALRLPVVDFLACNWQVVPVLVNRLNAFVRLDIRFRPLGLAQVFMDFIIDPKANVFPMVAAGKGLSEMILAEDL